MGFIVKNENGGNPYWLLDQKGNGDPQRTCLEISAERFKSKKKAENIIKNVVKEWGFMRKFDESSFEIVEVI